MNTLTLVCIIASAAFAAARPDSTYPDRYDNVNVREVIANHRLLDGYVNCLLEKGRCSVEGKELKSHIKEALENYCGKCTTAQRDGTKIVLAHLINNEPSFWEQLTTKYDPQRKYVTKYEDELKTIKA